MPLLLLLLLLGAPARWLTALCERVAHMQSETRDRASDDHIYETGRRTKVSIEYNITRGLS